MPIAIEIVPVNDHIMKKHAYDIELFEVFRELKEKYVVGSDVRILKEMDNYDFFVLQENNLLRRISWEGDDVEKIIDSGHYIVSYESSAYLSLLGWKLLVIDPNRIDGFLSYQMTFCTGDYYEEQIDFMKFVEDITYDFVKSSNYHEETIRNEKIMEWVQKNKFLIGISDHKGLKTKLDNAQLKSLHEQLMNTFIDQETQLVHFLSAFEDNPLPYNFVPIIWLVSKHTLSELLERTTDYKNRNGHQYLPDKIRVEIVPELFIDEHNHKITLNKKPTLHSKYIHDIEALVQSIQ